MLYPLAVAGPLPSRVDHSVPAPDYFAAVIAEFGLVQIGHLLLSDLWQMGVGWHSDALLPAWYAPLCHESIAWGYM